MVRVLGIDPGSRKTGFGVVDDTSNGPVLVECGVIALKDAALSDRLRQIYLGIQAIVARHAPTELAIEQVFMHKNPDSALKLGQARGAAICGGFSAGLVVHEYAARQVKLALVGKGNAEKLQVQHMVKVLLKLRDTSMPVDSSDALGVALCHIHHRQTQLKMKRAVGARAT